MKTFTVEKKYLLIPVWIGGERDILQVWEQEKKVYEFSVPAENKEGVCRYDYYAPVSVNRWMGKQLTVKGDFSRAFFEALAFSDQVMQAVQNRPEIHFSANTGWLNDPNGLLYDKGCYHLYFQHNPFDTVWDNMCWGHAVSKDLLHWEQQDTVMFPDEEGTIYSGCGLKNERKMLGLPEDALLFFYTSAGQKSAWSKNSKFRQKMAYSLDGGMHVVKKDGFVLDYIAEESRDPKVYWHEESEGYYMVLYLQRNDFGIFRSADLEHWEQTQEFTLDRAWECPDLREIPVESGGSKWVFFSADGFYYLGEFDGYRFKTDGVRRNICQTLLPYAAQTFWGTDAVIMISWLRTENGNKPYRGVMSLPKKLTLDDYRGELSLRQLPVDGYYGVRKEVFRKTAKHIEWRQGGKAPLELQIYGKNDIPFQGRIFGNVYSYDSVSGRLKVEMEETVIGEEIRELSVLLDEEICEITADNGFCYAAFEIDVHEEQKEIVIDAGEEINVIIYVCATNCQDTCLNCEKE